MTDGGFRAEKGGRGARTYGREHHIRREEDEVLLVERADAVVHPWAVVIHPSDAVPADGAMVRAGRLEVAVAPAALAEEPARTSASPSAPSVGRAGGGRRHPDLETSVLWPTGIAPSCTR